MFWHNFKYNLLVLIRSKDQIFWSLLFVIGLGTLFFVTFGNAYKTEEALSEIKVAVYFDDEAVKKNFEMFIADISIDEKNGKKLLDITYSDNLDDAKQLLFGKKVKGVYYSENGELKLLVTKQEIKEGILASIVSNYHEIITLMNKISDKESESQYAAMLKLLMGNNTNEEISLTDASLDPFTSYFYNLLAMGCLFSCFAAITYVNRNQANLSAVGARTTASGANGFICSVAGLMANWLLLFLIEIIAMIYIKVIGVNLGGNYPGIVLILFVGTFAGMALGYLIGSIGTKSLDAKIGISVAVSLVLCFLSGLMVADMKVIIEDSIPMLNRINPAALISDSFYALNIYDDYAVFTRNIVTLTIMSVGFIIIGSLLGRRKRYASL